MSRLRFSLIILRHDSGAALQALLAGALSLRALDLDPEIFIAAKAASLDMARIAGPGAAWAHEKISLLPPASNRGATLQRALAMAKGDFIGVIDADGLCPAPDLPALLAPCLEGRADAVFASRRLGERAASSFWRGWQRSFLTLASGMLSNLDLADPFCPCKIFSAGAAAKIVSGPGAARAAEKEFDKGTVKGQARGADKDPQKGGWPELKGDGPGLEAAMAARAALAGLKVLEHPLAASPAPGPGHCSDLGPGPGPAPGVLSMNTAACFRALYGIIHHCAPYAPLPAQMLLYLFIGAASLLANLLAFTLLLHLGSGPGASVILAFICSSCVNYLLCIALLFRHKARWSGPVEAAAFLAVVLFMGLVDYGVTLGLMATDAPPLAAKFCGAVIGFFLNFFLRRQVLFRIGKG